MHIGKLAKISGASVVRSLTCNRTGQRSLADKYSAHCLRDYEQMFDKEPARCRIDFVRRITPDAIRSRLSPRAGWLCSAKNHRRSQWRMPRVLQGDREGRHP